MNSLPIPHRKKADLAYEFLREQIVNGAFVPGQRMTLAELAARCNMSHMPVREALVRLEREALIEGEPHKGMRVAGLSTSDARDLFAIRRELEGLAAERACQSADATLADALAALNRQFATAFEAADVTCMGEANRAFHRRILAAADSSHLSRILEDVWTASLRYRMGYRLIPGRAERTVAEHDRLIAALRAGDAGAARAAARDHITQAGDDLAATLARELQDGAAATP